MMTSLDINANPGESEDDEVEMSSMKTVTRRRSKNSSEYDDFGLIEVHPRPSTKMTIELMCLLETLMTLVTNMNMTKKRCRPS